MKGNRFRGDANQLGTGMLSPAIMFSAVNVEVADIRVCFNNFAGTDAQVRWNSNADDDDGGGAFVDVPIAMGNNGAGLPFTFPGHQSPVRVVMIGGNETFFDGVIPPASSSTAMYCGSGEPEFIARKGSIYMRTDGEPETDDEPGTLLWVNKDNGAGVAAVRRGPPTETPSAPCARCLSPRPEERRPRHRPAISSSCSTCRSSLP